MRDTMKDTMKDTAIPDFIEDGQGYLNLFLSAWNSLNTLFTAFTPNLKTIQMKLPY